MIRKSLFLMLLAGLVLPARRAHSQAQPQAATNAQDEQVNVLIPPRPEGALEGSLLIMRTDDTTADVDYFSRVYELAVEGWEVLPFLRDIVDQEAGNVNFWTYTDPRSGEERHYVQAVTADYQFEGIDELISRFNHPGATSHRGGMRRHVRVRHRLASDLADILRAGVISEDGFVEADDATNTLFIRDSGSDGARALEVLRYYDVPQRMVEMEVKIVEVDASDTTRLGLDWDAWKNSLGGFLQLTAAERSGIPGDFSSFDTLLNLDARVLADFLNYLVREGSATIVTHTTLTAINGESASLESSRRIPVIRSRSAPGTVKVVEEVPGLAGTLVAEEGGLRTRLRDEGREDEFISIRIFPRIGAETMLAEISAEVSSVTGENQLDEPLVVQSAVESMIRLHDGEPVLVGAFDQTRQVDSESRIPILGRIPWIGSALFAERGTRSRQSKLIVLMTPHVDALMRYTDEQIEYGRRILDDDAPAYTERARKGLDHDILRSVRQTEARQTFGKERPQAVAETPTGGASH